MVVMPNTIIKPWGFEIKLTDDSLPYSGKIAFTKAGHRWSLQSHDQKTETIPLLSGQAKFTLGQDTSEMKPNIGYTVLPNTIHRFEAISDCVTVEIATPEIGTTTRLEDDFNRPSETETIRNSPNRGWNNSNE